MKGLELLDISQVFIPCPFFFFFLVKDFIKQSDATHTDCSGLCL